jgi:hypothetical protein
MEVVGYSGHVLSFLIRSTSRGLEKGKAVLVQAKRAA